MKTRQIAAALGMTLMATGMAMATDPTKVPFPNPCPIGCMGLVNGLKQTWDCNGGANAGCCIRNLGQKNEMPGCFNSQTQCGNVCNPGDPS